ncbi:BTAD domain-containing putative transcriptional regulator [Microtetraspora niveoalba]|uniref:BTAD domain-containing putative transcriptional regulator n=1 Tax=Microtetraspora niveoalba TaxID=46175 RepID=UPI00082C1C9E|nr:BTAD domain-containing putative transcriptional regulator [Microtetraspora niveoalba]
MLVGILGPLRMPAGEIRGARLRALVVRLALEPGRVVTTERLIDDLWEDDPPENPSAALQSLVSRLRRRIGSLVVSHPSGYRLDAEVDAVHFERLASDGRRALRRGDPARAADLLREALTLWRGEPLADAAGLIFATAPVARLEEVRLRALGDRVEADLASGVPGAALVAELRDLVTEHPLHEPYHVLLIRGLLAAGRRADALTAYERVRRLLAEELGADPGDDLRAAHLAALGDGRPGPARARRDNLPARHTTFVGRTDDVRRVAGLLEHRRLVTLTGPGGAGKTRLAIEVAANMAAPQAATAAATGEAPILNGTGVSTDRSQGMGTGPGGGSLSPDLGRSQAVGAGRGLEGWEAGVWSGGGSLFSDLGRSQGVGAGRGLEGWEAGVWSGGASLFPDGVWLVELAPVGADAVAAVLSNTVGPIAELTDRRLLLVLDNCEHVVEAVTELVEKVLAASPGVHVLATGREPLDLPGETLHPVKPLDLAPAMALFADRASAVSPDFALDDTMADDVAAICTRLDGMPLAIELTAARLRSLPLSRLAAVIEDRLLDRGSRTAQRRHRTLRAVIGWSWDLLDEAERRLLARMSVFAGGATAEAIERVCGADLDVLVSLVDKSLVQVSGDRYRLLESVRRFAAEQLAAEQTVAEQTVAEQRRAHLAHYLEFAEAADPLLRTGDQVRVLAEVDAERGNLDAALRYAVATDRRAALRLFAARTWTWIMRTEQREAAEWAALLVAGEPPEGAESEHALCLVIAPGDRLDGVSRMQAGAGRPVALVAWSLGDGYAEDVVERALAATAGFEDHPDPWARATSLLVRGLVTLEFVPRGAAIAEGLLEEALAGYLRIGERWGLAMTRYWLSLALENRGDSARALAMLEQAAASAAEIGCTQVLPAPGMLAVRLAQLRGRTGDLAGARAGLAAAREGVERTGEVSALARIEYALGELARRDGDRAKALRRLARARELLDGQVTSQQFRALLEVELARSLEPAEGRARLRDALDREFDDDIARATVWEGVAEWCLSVDDPRRAAILLGAARRLRGIEETADESVRALVRRCAEALGPDRFAAAWDSYQGQIGGEFLD